MIDRAQVSARSVSLVAGATPSIHPPAPYRETALDEVGNVHGHLLDLCGVELLDVTEVPHITLRRRAKPK